jgi:hypothetical protein
MDDYYLIHQDKITALQKMMRKVGTESLSVLGVKINLYL